VRIVAILRIDEIREMSSEDREKNLNELNLKMLRFNAKIASGGNVENPGEIKEIKRTIAKIKTIENEEAQKKLIEELQS
jgi:large subunit ribosomal protein L29